MNKAFLAIATLVFAVSTLSAGTKAFKQTKECIALHNTFMTETGDKGFNAYNKFMDLQCEIKEESNCNKPKKENEVQGCYVAPIKLR